MKYKSLTFKTLQGLGDIVWCLQRLHPYFEEVHIKIMMINDEPLQRRSQPLFRAMFPDFVKSVEMEPCTNIEYNAIYNSYWYVENILKEYRDNEELAQNHVFTLASNKQLEDGLRLEQLEPQLSVTEVLPYSFKDATIPFTDYMILYVSGTKMDLKCWSEVQWVEYIELIYRKFNYKLPIILTGAEFDRNTLTTVGNLLHSNGHTVSYYIGGDPQQTLDFIRKAKFFVGYQSGLNILCDQLDVPQIMLYFDFLQKLRTSWPKQKNLENKTHQYFGFEDNPQLVATNTLRPY